MRDEPRMAAALPSTANPTLQPVTTPSLSLVVISETESHLRQQVARAPALALSRGTGRTGPETTIDIADQTMQ